MAYRDGTQSGAGLGRSMSREKAMAMIAAQDGQFGQNEAQYQELVYAAQQDAQLEQQMAAQEMDRFGMSPGSQNQAIYRGSEMTGKRPLSPLAQWAMEQSMFDPKQEVAQKEQEEAMKQQQAEQAR